jgi:hypothetical protein
MKKIKKLKELSKFNELSSFMVELFDCVEKGKDLNDLFTLSGNKEYTYKWILKEVKDDYDSIMKWIDELSKVEKIFDSEE